MTIAELRQKAQRRTSNVYDTLFTRRVSIYLTAILFPLGVSANTISAFNTLVALAACSLIAFGVEPWHALTGIGLVHLYAVLDSVDGELARLRRTFTVKGLFLEDLSAFTMINGFFLAVAYYLYRYAGVVWALTLAVVVVGFGRNAMQAARRAIFKWLESRRALPALTTHLGKGSQLGRIRRLVEDQLLHYTNIWISLTTLIAIDVLWSGSTRTALSYVFAFYTCAVLAKELAAIAVLATTGELVMQATEITDNARATPTESAP